MNEIFYVWTTDKFLSGLGCVEGKIHKQVVECPSREERDRILYGFEGHRREFKYTNWGFSIPKWDTSKYTWDVRPSSEWTRF